MKSITMLMMALVVACPALAQSVAEKTGVNSITGAAPSTVDFVMEASVSDMFEIKSSMMAEKKGDSVTKSFAAEMVKDHKKTSDQLKKLVNAGTVQATLATDVDKSHQDLLETLSGLSGQDFTTQYDKDQVSAHKDAVSLFQRYAKGGDNTKLSQWAGKTLPTLQAHLKMAEDLGKN